MVSTRLTSCIWKHCLQSLAWQARFAHLSQSHSWKQAIELVARRLHCSGNCIGTVTSFCLHKNPNDSQVARF
jgi:hypothetical protein